MATPPNADERGSILAVTNGSGAASGSGFGIHSYDEYGTPGPSNNSRFQYTGQAWLPEAQLYHYKARAYSPSLGRFLQTDFTALIDTLIVAGRYASASEAVREGLRLLEEREAKLVKLRELIREGDESGEPQPFDVEEFLAEMHASAARNA